MTGIRVVATTTSTNDDLLGLARDGAPEGTWLRAVSQSGGRGRHGRPWISPPGNLYASTLVRPGAGDPPPATLALVAAVALEEAVAAYVPAERLQLKWPNDLLLDGAKLSGILLEAAGEAVVIGIGVNLAVPVAGTGRATASIAEAIGSAPSAADFLDILVPAFARWLSNWRGSNFEAVRRRWLERAHPIGTALAADTGSERIEGLFDGLEPDGALRLKTPAGIVVIRAGDLFLL